MDIEVSLLRGAEEGMYIGEIVSNAERTSRAFFRGRLFVASMCRYERCPVPAFALWIGRCKMSGC